MLSDEAYIIENMFKIANKDGEDVDFILNEAQRNLDENLSFRNLVPKARQRGVTSFILAKDTVACLHKRNTRAVVISHDQESTQRMLNKVKYYIGEIRGPKPKISNMSQNLIGFPKTNSMFYIGTAGSRKFGRGDTITHLHGSEYAYWPNPQELMKGLLQAVPYNGEIVLESTGNGLNDYYRRCMQAYKGEGRWKLHFYPWHTEKEYRVDLTPDMENEFRSMLEEKYEEPALYKLGISLGQLFWRREKLEEMDFDLKAFKQEYPMTLDECFQTTGESVFHEVRYEPTDDWYQADRHLHILKGHPNINYTYCMGGDVAGGVGRDFSVLEIICLETNEQVGEYCNNQIDPQAFADTVKEIGDIFFFPFTVIENNNHGVLTLARLADIYPSDKLYKEVDNKGDEDTHLLSLGHRTNSRTKPLLIGTARATLAEGLVVHSPVLNSELSTFIEHPNGKLAAQEGCTDDTVIAMAEAIRGINRAATFKAKKERARNKHIITSPFAVNQILKEMEKKGREYPISPQNASRWS